MRGGKARTCCYMAGLAKQGGCGGLVTAGSRSSPQVNIVAHMGVYFDLPVRCHVPTGELLPEVKEAVGMGAEVIQHRPGYNSVITSRARTDAISRGWCEIPFGMECREAVQQTRMQVRNIPDEVRRIVIPIGSGMSAAGILWGLRDAHWRIPVLGIVVGASPVKRLNNFAPGMWRYMIEFKNSGYPYDREIVASLDGVLLDPIYEAKCVQFLEDNDLLWVVGIRSSVV